MRGKRSYASYLAALGESTVDFFHFLVFNGIENVEFRVAQ